MPVLQYLTGASYVSFLTPESFAAIRSADHPAWACCLRWRRRFGSGSGCGHTDAYAYADSLVKKGLPFRDAQETVAHAVKAALSHAVDLSELPLAGLQQFHPKIEKDVYECLSLRGSLNARNTLGGTAPAQVRAQIARHRARLG